MSQTTKLRVEGMSCGHCVGRVERALRGVEGVTEVTVSLEAGEATVAHDATRVTVDALLRAVDEAGYDASA
ncbi:MAG: heavy-metal-associated domain-containing protein [Myxococcales bacterium]|nr:heavy-metal-associated domain-containing protein [Myxococcales bacterium]